MVTDTEKLLGERLKQIDCEIEALKQEKSKVKQSLGIFRTIGENSQPTSTLMIKGEPIFKEKVKAALRERYTSGVSALELLDYLNSNWQRQVKRESLSPQLSRLKDEGILELNNGIWSLKSENPAEAGPSSTS